MLNGLELEDATTGAHEKSKIKSMNFEPFIAYQIISNNKNFSKLKVAIAEGKNRELRRFFGHFGLEVMDLKRFEFGGISLNNLPTGKSRYLTKDEYKDLRLFLNENE
jgi:23S rRNA pseudouridine2605 synthase